MIITVFLIFLKVWASSYLPNDPAKAEQTQHLYYKKHNSPMLLDYVKLETERKVSVKLW